jgi:hypothetical protein
LISRGAIGLLAAGQALSSDQVRSASTNYDYIVNAVTFFHPHMLRTFGDIDSREYSIAMQSIKGNKLSEQVIEDWLDRSGMIVVAD